MSDMSVEMRKRWSMHHHIAQADESTDSDFRPSARVQATRGYFRFGNRPEPTMQHDGNFRGWWDEKYFYEGTFNNPRYGEDRRLMEREASVQGPTEVPHITSIEIWQDIKSNGMTQATITLQNAAWVEQTDAEEYVYHEFAEGFMSPFYSGDDLGTRTTHADLFEQGWQTEAGDEYRYDDDGNLVTGLLLPNRKIEVFQGYGDEMQRTFVGFIQHVSVEMNPATITLTCVDFGSVMARLRFFGTNFPKFKQPVSFGDFWHWPLRGKRGTWPRHGGYTNMNLVKDITDIPMLLFRWAGFADYATVKAGRLGMANINQSKSLGLHNAIIRGEHFDKSNYYVDGLNRMKDLLGYCVHFTPDWADGRPGEDRYRDPDYYDVDGGRYSIGIPHFEPYRIWDPVKRNDTSIDQYMQDTVLINGTFEYDADTLRRAFWATGPGYSDAKGKRRMFAQSAMAPGLMNVATEEVLINLEEHFGKVKLTEPEIQVWLCMLAMQSLMWFSKGTFQIPGNPGMRLNEMCDVHDDVSGTWRRFYVTGWRSSMTLGPTSTYKTTVNAINVENIYIDQLRRHVIDLVGHDFHMAKRPRVLPT